MMRTARWVWSGWMMAGLLLGGAPMRAHDGPEHEIEELTERIDREGASADLLLQRAVEYNVLGKAKEAARDLEQALELDPASANACRELGRAYFDLGKTNEALEVVKRGLKHAAEGPEQASLLVLRSEVLAARRDYEKALDDLNAAIRQHPENAEWYYARSQLQEHLKKKEERIEGLEHGIRETGSGLLEGEWLDALIDAGKSEVAGEKIEAGLRDARWKSTWLIRRAKVHLAAGKKTEARADLKAAVEELNQRITSTARDPLLIADRGMARELLGEKEDARKDYESARDKGMTDEWVQERIKTLKGSSRKKDDEKDEDEKKDKGEEDKDDKSEDEDKDK